MTNRVSGSPVNGILETTARIAELTNRLCELERPAKLENPGITVDDANLRVDPVTQPVLTELRGVQKEIDGLNAWLALPDGGPATPVLQTETEPNDTAATADPLDFGTQSAATVAGTIGVAGDVDFYSFSGTAGARVWIHVDTGSPPAQVGTSRDSLVDLISTDGTTVIETDDDDGTGNGGDGTTESGFASVISGRVLPSTGTFFVRVRQSNGNATIDPYRLYVHTNSLAPTPEVESNDSAATANALIVPPNVVGYASGTLMPGDNDFFSVSLQAGDRVFIAVDGDPARDGMSTGVRFQLRDTNGVSVLLLANSGSTSGGFNAEGFVYDIPVSGTYFVRVFGGAGNTTGDYTLLVDDTDGFNDCTVTCPQDQTVAENPPMSGGAVVNYPDPTPSPTCGDIVCSPASGSTFPVGTTTVTCQEDAVTGRLNGQVIPSCTFTITVTPSTTTCTGLTCPASMSVSVDEGQCSADVTYTAPSDPDCGTITCTPSSGSSFPVGTTTVTCTSTAGPSCSFTVTVNDDEPPTIDCPGNVTQSNDTDQCGATVNYTVPTGSDNCADVVVSCTPDTGSFFPVGTTTVTCTATDGPGNTATCSFLVTVNDTQAPSITCPGPIAARGTVPVGCEVGGVVNYSAPVVTDACPGTTVACVPPSGSMFQEGTTTVTCTATDPAGNSNSCSFTVTIGASASFGVCFVDDFTGDTWSIVTDPTSPLYRFWRYRVAATGEIICGTANFLAFVPNRSLSAYDRDDPRFVMQAYASWATKTATVTVDDKSPQRRFILRDRNILNNPPCQ